MGIIDEIKWKMMRISKVVSNNLSRRIAKVGKRNVKWTLNLGDAFGALIAMMSLYSHIIILASDSGSKSPTLARTHACLLPSRSVIVHLQLQSSFILIFFFNIGTHVHTPGFHTCSAIIDTFLIIIFFSTTEAFHRNT